MKLLPTSHKPKWSAVPSNSSLAWQERGNMFDWTSINENLQIFIVYKTERVSNKNKKTGITFVISRKKGVRWGVGKKLKFSKHESTQKHRNLSWLQASVSLMRQRRNTMKWNFLQNLRNPHEMSCQTTILQLNREHVLFAILSYTRDSTKNKKNGRWYVISLNMAAARSSISDSISSRENK